MRNRRRRRRLEWCLGRRSQKAEAATGRNNSWSRSIGSSSEKLGRRRDVRYPEKGGSAGLRSERPIEIEAAEIAKIEKTAKGLRMAHRKGQNRISMR
jgi:hypothetical protein